MTVTTDQSKTGVRLGPQDYVVDLTPSTSGVAQLAEQILKQYTLPAGLLRSCRYFSIKALYTKTGTTDAGTPIFRLGTAGTTADTVINTDSSGMSAASRERSSEAILYANSATVIRAVTAAKTATFHASTSTTAFPQDTTVSNMDTNTLILSLNTTMAGTTDTPQVAHAIITLYP